MMKKLLMILFLGVATSSLGQLKVVTDPDWPEAGWWWLPSDSGWGLNCDLQPASFTGAGNFMFCALFTYDTDGNPKWYTMSGEYVPNPDVFAWREDRGLMGSFTGPLYVSTGGACHTCSPQGPQTEPSELGDVQIDWVNPLSATITIDGVTKDMVFQYYHAGLQVNDADFITDGVWYIQAVFQNTLLKGLFKFEKLDLADASGWQNTETISLNPDLEWYTSLTTPANMLFGPSDSNILTTSGFVSEQDDDNSVLMAYDKNTNEAVVFLVDEFLDNVSLRVCNDFGANRTASGILRPAVSSNTRLYFAEGELDNCESSGLTLEQQRQVFVSMTRIPQGGDDMGQIPVFLNGDFDF